MKNRDFKGPTSTDLLVCFPTRAHLTLMPKRICSPARPSNSGNNHHPQNFQRHPHNHHSHLKNPIKRTGAPGHSSPSLWSKNKPTNSDISEPTSPKVTCAGQIKVSHKTNKFKNWQSVMEEIEKLHIKKQKKKHAWVGTLGFKKEVMQFLTCLRSLSLDFRCFGSIPDSDTMSDDEDEDEEDDDFDGKCGNIERDEDDEDDEASRTVFSKWFMVLQEDKNKDLLKNQFKEEENEQCVPPPNALLLMRCRSAPAKSWLEEREDEEGEEEEETEEDEEEEVEDKNEEEKRNLRFLMEEEKQREKESMQGTKYDNDFARFSTDIAKETWVVGGIRGSLSKC